MNNYKKGRSAETLAARYLMEKGYHIWKSNWRWGRKEVDLITINRGELVIVEVKSMQGNQVNHPAEVVDRQKQRNIILATEAFIRLHNCSLPTRFDVISVIYSGSGVEIDHLADAFYPLPE